MSHNIQGMRHNLLMTTNPDNHMADNNIISIDETKAKKKAEVKESIKDQRVSIYDYIDTLTERVEQLIAIEQRLLNKVGDLECRLDTNGFPPGQSHWAGFKFKPDGTIEKQETDKFTQDGNKLISE